MSYTPTACNTSAGVVNQAFNVAGQHATGAAWLADRSANLNLDPGSLFTPITLDVRTTRFTYNPPNLRNLSSAIESAPSSLRLDSPRRIASVPHIRFTHDQLGAFGVFEPTVSASLPDLGFDPPKRPDQVELGVLREVPALSLPTPIQFPDVTGITLPNVGNAPNFTGSLNFNFGNEPGGRPNLPTLTAPTVNIPAIPPEPTWTDPTEVTLSEINLPTLVPINLPDLTTIEVPSLTVPELKDRLDFEDEEFDTGLLDEIIEEVREVLGGRLAMPQEIWTRIWERATADLNRQYIARTREARRSHSRLGWSMPGGVMLEALQTAQTDINAQIADQRNQAAIKQAEMQREDYWQAMERGIACMSLLSEIHNARQERLLRAAIAEIEAQTAVYNAVIAAYNARVQAITVDVEVKKLQLQGELTKLEVYKTEMEGVKLGVEVDKARVDLYIAQWQGIKTRVEAFEAFVRAIGIQVDAQKSAVEVYGEQIKAQGQLVQMWATEWDAYAKGLETERLKLGKYEADARVFESHINRFRAGIEGQNIRTNAQIEERKLRVQRAQLDTTRYQSDWTLPQLELSAHEAHLKTQQFPLEAAKINADIYQSQIQGELGKVQAFSARYDAYTKLLQKDAIRAQLQNSYASMYGAFVSREQLGIELTKIGQDIGKVYESLKQEYNKALVSERQAELGYLGNINSTRASVFGAAASLYGSDVQGQAAEMSTNASMKSVEVELEKAKAQMAQAEAQLRVGAWQARAQIETSSLNAAASVYAQLGSAAYAATNASISDSCSRSNSSSTSSSTNTNYNYSMEK